MPLKAKQQQERGGGRTLFSAKEGAALKDEAHNRLVSLRGQKRSELINQMKRKKLSMLQGEGSGAFEQVQPVFPPQIQVASVKDGVSRIELCHVIMAGPQDQVLLAMAKLNKTLQEFEDKDLAIATFQVIEMGVVAKLLFLFESCEADQNVRRGILELFTNLTCCDKRLIAKIRPRKLVDSMINEVRMRVDPICCKYALYTLVNLCMASPDIILNQIAAQDFFLYLEDLFNNFYQDTEIMVLTVQAIRILLTPSEALGKSKRLTISFQDFQCQYFRVLTFLVQCLFNSFNFHNDQFFRTNGKGLRMLSSEASEFLNYIISCLHDLSLSLLEVDEEEAKFYADYGRKEMEREAKKSVSDLIANDRFIEIAIMILRTTESLDLFYNTWTLLGWVVSNEFQEDLPMKGTVTFRAADNRPMPSILEFGMNRDGLEVASICTLLLDQLVCPRLSDYRILKSSLFTLSNYLAEDYSTVSGLIRQGVVGHLFQNWQIVVAQKKEVNKLPQGPHRRAEKLKLRHIMAEFVHCISNITEGVKKGSSSIALMYEVLTIAVEQGALAILLEALDTTLVRPKTYTIYVALEGLQNYFFLLQGAFENPDPQLTRFQAAYLKMKDKFEFSGGLDIVESLQAHKNHRVYSYALKFLEEFFAEDDCGPFSEVLALAEETATEFDCRQTQADSMMDLNESIGNYK